jgi:hypothetical protein
MEVRMHALLAAGEVVPTECVAVGRKTLVQRCPHLREQLADVSPLLGGQVEGRSAMLDWHTIPEPGRTSGGSRGSRVEA